MIAVIWGWKIVRTRLGRRAEYCPLCRGITPFRLEFLHQIGHLYFLPLGERKDLGYRLTCESCGLSHFAEYLEDSRASKDRRVAIEPLVAQTNPDVLAQVAARIERDGRVHAGTLEPDERAAEIRRSFELAEALFDQKASHDQVSRVWGRAFLGVTALAILLGVAGSAAGFGVERSAAMATLAWFIGIAAGLAWSILTPRILAHDDVEPLLAWSLRPLRPGLGEIDAEILHLRSRGKKLGTYLDPHSIQKLIQSG
jgi:hypothetical protein